MSECPFCNANGFPITEDWQLLRDNYPVSEGHALLVPRRHIQFIYELTQQERAQLGAALSKAYFYLEMTTRCFHGFNVGINQGEAAGQTVEHLHVHIIPRRDGDVEDPRGGVRGVIPHKRNY